MFFPGLRFVALACSTRSSGAAQRRLRGELQDQPVVEPHVDGRQVARQDAVLAIEPQQFGDRLVLIQFGQLDGDAVLQPQVPAALGDADITFYARGQFGELPDLVDESRGILGRAVADDQRQRRMTTAAERLDHIAIALDDGQLRAMLPDRERLPLLDPHFSASDRPQHRGDHPQAARRSADAPRRHRRRSARTSPHRWSSCCEDARLPTSSRLTGIIATGSTAKPQLRGDRPAHREWPV